jgi:hypothetical protein
MYIPNYRPIIDNLPDEQGGKHNDPATMQPLKSD